MLVLSRKEGERICIGENIVVTVVSVRGDRVRLGFEGPREVPIHREEIMRAIHEFPQVESDSTYGAHEPCPML
ncbi:MAG: carbon storage regulator CsrA [Pirellulales bacterium]